MTNLTSRRGRRGAAGPIVRERARHRRRVAVVVALCGTVVVLGMSATATANAPSPVTETLQPGTVLINPNGTVTVNAHGLWVWPFGIESEHTAGLQATSRHKCDHRVGAGWGILWNDPNDSGLTETYHTKLKGGRKRNLSLTVNVGSKGVNSANTDMQVQYNTSDPCGMFVLTNVPARGDGYDVGAWAARHTYADVAALPSEICLVTYDLGVGKGAPAAHRTSYTNNDNSVQWQLVNMGGYSTSVTGKNCNSLPAPVNAPLTPTTTIVPVSKTTHNPTTTTPPARVVTTTSHTLAFTGVGNTGRLVALLGALLVLLGLLVYFVDIRRATTWLLGAARPSGQSAARHHSAVSPSVLPGGTWSRDAMQRGRAARAARGAHIPKRGMMPGKASPRRSPGMAPRAAQPAPGRRPPGGRGGSPPRRPAR